MDKASSSFLARHEFLIRRLHSLSGLIPVGAFTVVHLLANASTLGGGMSYQNTVYQIHSLGAILPVVEWVFIFIPILFHAILGVVIIRGGLPNSGAYPLQKNVRYTLQRATGMIAFVFIVWHVFHMHGWFHFDAWVNNVAKPLMGSQFRAFNAASTGGAAMQASILIPILYAVGVLSIVYHLANGIWTMGITWGVWTTPAAQRRADRLCMGFGLLLAAVGLGAIVGFERIDVNQALREQEKEAYEMRVEAGLVEPDEEKRAVPHEPAESETARLEK
ncbi:MAG: succinate dehydrogenase cytochrome b558 subunit [Pirellulaceae bacterium]